eukprot:TRINITY_DN18321_c0_g1_i2.p1 TRINITY_DN18321_c0_g1~~TRINITY_DN18321_c0_g1_i2.p1  ORF type:complete len:417 (+),score=101.23 TRINITY_DN18321_c0_g1_i2:49-1251(+)
MANPYAGNERSRPPEDLLGRVGEGQRRCIAGTAEQMQTSAAKDRMLQYREMVGLGRLLRFKGTLFSNCMKVVIAQLLFSLVVSAAHVHGGEWVAFDSTAHSYTIIPIGFLLVFRSTLSYTRWWDGRKLIGQLVFATRCLAYQSLNYLSADSDALLMAHCTKVIRWCLALVIAVRHSVQEPASQAGGLSPDQAEALGQLRNWELSHYIDEGEIRKLQESKAPRPMQIAWQLFRLINEPGGGLHYKWETAPQELQRHATEALESWQGMCKIVTTPMPFPYIHCLDWFLYIWVFTVPLSLLDDGVGLGWVTVPVAVALAVLLLGINEVGAEIEDPFGNDVNDFDIVRFQHGLHVELQCLTSVRFGEDAWPLFEVVRSGRAGRGRSGTLQAPSMRRPPAQDPEV